ncbi:MAG: exodeoxyribonuclease VII large subunit, partial [Bilophila sp.]
LIRGGGSLQDLWAFNDERVADAVFHSTIPVLAGIGHEVDTSLADMVADVRAATPSHAAQLLWPEREWYAQRLDELEMKGIRALHSRIDRQEKRLHEQERALAWLSPVRGLKRREEQFQNLYQRLQQHGQTVVARQSQQFDFAAQRLSDVFLRHLERLEHRHERLHVQLTALNPDRPLERGYAFALTPDGHFIRSITDLKQGGSLTVKLHDGEADACVTAIRDLKK